MAMKVGSAIFHATLNMVGSSSAMSEVRRQVGLVAGKPVDVLIRGDTGTGKELVALAIHMCNPHAAGRFVPVNCGGIPEALVESEFFGHERGAFTGALARHIGYFEQASGGTIFLDEVGDLPLIAQAKLLRVLEDKRIERVGSLGLIRVNTRVVAATNRSLESAIEQGQFRQDLFYRLNAFTVCLPPLSQRLEDIPDLVHFFIERFRAELELESTLMQPEALAFLENQPWPGNVRQLESVTRHAMLESVGPIIKLSDVRNSYSRSQGPLRLEQHNLEDHFCDLLARAEQGQVTDAYSRMLEAVERRFFAQAMHRAKGNQAEIARWLGISRTTVREKVNRFGLQLYNKRTQVEGCLAAPSSESRNALRIA